MRTIAASALTLLIFLSGPASEANVDFRHSSIAAESVIANPVLSTLARVIVTNFFGIVKIAELASQGFWPFDRTAIVIRSRIAAL